jgi:hypothetical protein
MVIVLLVQFIPLPIVTRSFRRARHQFISSGGPISWYVRHKAPLSQTETYVSWRSLFIDLAVGLASCLVVAGLTLRKKMYLSLYIVFVITIPVALIGLRLSMAVPNWLTEEARTRYAHTAVARIKALDADKEILQKKIKTEQAQRLETDGIRQPYMVMENGEWMLYYQEAGKADFVVGDLFIGKGSDGRWYYSPSHFCVDMLCARMDGPLPNLKHFLENEMFKFTTFATVDELLESECYKKDPRRR